MKKFFIFLVSAIIFFFAVIGYFEQVHTIKSKKNDLVYEQVIPGTIVESIPEKPDSKKSDLLLIIEYELEGNLYRKNYRAENNEFPNTNPGDSVELYKTGHEIQSKKELVDRSTDGVFYNKLYAFLYYFLFLFGLVIFISIFFV